MPDLTFLITQIPSLSLPTSALSWLGWLVFIIVIIFVNLKWKFLNRQLDPSLTRVFILLIISVPLVTLFLPAVQIFIGGEVISLPVLGAVPWFLAAGFLGPGYASVIALISGLVVTVWGGMNFFFPLEIAAAAASLSWLFFQEYRTPIYRYLRHPFFSSIVLMLAYPLIYMLSTLILSQGSLGIRFTFGLDHILTIFLYMGVYFLLAGAISEGFAVAQNSKWGAPGQMKPSPAERRMSTRFLISVVPLSVFLIAILIFSAWSIAGRAARQMLEGRMSTAAEITAQSIPFYLENGQNLILSLSNDAYYDLAPEEIQKRLAYHRREIPYFTQLIYVDPNGELITRDPFEDFDMPSISPEEQNRIAAASIVPFDITAVSSGRESNAAILSFVAGVKDNSGALRGVLIGRSDLTVNPYSKSIITGMESVSGLGGYGMLIDENNFILYHPDPNFVMQSYVGGRSNSPQFFEENSTDGEKELVYSYPVIGKPWNVIVKVPSSYIDQQASSFALPLIGIITLFVIMAVFIFRYGLRSVTTSLEDLALHANRISRGELDQPLELHGEDEVGQLRFAFEQMRSSLKSRLDELNRLLFVSQGIASTMDIEVALERVLDSALDIGASSARIYLFPSVVPDRGVEKDPALCLGSGPATEQYSYLDEQVAKLNEKQQVLKLNNLSRPKLFSNSEDQIPPQAILALALRHDNQLLGTLWVAFDQPHQFLDEEIRYISTLAGQAVLAIENSRLYLTSEIGRQRLASVLDATPDAVLVTDHDNNLLVLNSAAEDLFKLYDGDGIGKPISESIANEQLNEIYGNGLIQPPPNEITLMDGNTYSVSISTVEVEGIRAGRVCVLRNVTTIKQLNASKSDFVSTVSHDLRSPLALIQGYTSMLQMVGELNDQQASYLKKISDETEKISHLVTNLLDLGRIEAEVGLHLEKKTVDDVIDRVVAASQVQADQKRINLTTRMDLKNPPIVEADQALLQQALYNLVDNAIKFTEPGGEVNIGLNLLEDSVVYIIEDNGIGISPADQQYLFDKFFRSTNQQRLEAGGSGLGLAIANSIAEKHSGKITVKSKLGIGSTFYLELPLRQSTK